MKMGRVVGVTSCDNAEHGNAGYQSSFRVVSLLRPEHGLPMHLLEHVHGPGSTGELVAQPLTQLPPMNMKMIAARGGAGDAIIHESRLRVRFHVAGGTGGSLLMRLPRDKGSEPSSKLSADGALWFDQPGQVDIRAPFSPIHPVTLDRGERQKASIPDDASHFAFV